MNDYSKSFMLGRMSERMKNKMLGVIKETEHYVLYGSENSTRPNYFIVLYQDSFLSGMEIGTAASKSIPLVIFSLEEKLELAQCGTYYYCQDEDEMIKTLEQFIKGETLVKTNFNTTELWLKGKIRPSFESELQKTIEILKEMEYELCYDRMKTYAKGSDIMDYLTAKQNGEEKIRIGINSNEKSGVIERVFINFPCDDIEEKAKVILGTTCLDGRSKDELAEPFKIFNKNRLILVC